MVIFDLEIDNKDPLDLIERNKDFVRHLRGNGIDGFKISKIFDNFHGLKIVVPISVTSQFTAKNRQIEYAMRYTKALVSNDAILDEEKKYLREIWKRLCKEYVPLEAGKSGHPVKKVPIRPGDQGTAKTYKQMVGKQVVILHKYIKPFNKMYPQKIIFDLIAELFEVVRGEKFTQRQIVNFDKNNF